MTTIAEWLLGVGLTHGLVQVRSGSTPSCSRSSLKVSIHDFNRPSRLFRQAVGGLCHQWISDQLSFLPLLPRATSHILIIGWISQQPGKLWRKICAGRLLCAKPVYRRGPLVPYLYGIQFSFPPLPAVVAIREPWFF